MKISLIIGLITLVIGSLGQNCPSFFSGEDCSKIQCVNGGYPDSTAKVCTCPPGYLGIHCEAVKTSRPPNNHYKAGGTSFNILNVNLYTQYWGVKTYQNIRKAIETFQTAYKFDVYNYGFNKNSPFLDTFDDPQGFPINFSTTDSKTPLSLDAPMDTGLYWCYQVDIYKSLVSMIRDGGLRNTAITIITQHPPSSDYLEEAQQTTVAFGIRVNVLWISDKTFNLCQDADIAAFKAFSELTGGLFVQLQSESDDAPTQKLVSQVLLTHYRPQFVSIQSFDSCDSPQSVPVVIDPVVKGPYNFVFLGTNASPTSQSFVSCLLQQPIRSFDNQLSIFQSPDPACLSVSVKATGPCTVMVFTNGNYSNPGPIDLSIYTSYVEDQTIDSSRYGIVKGVPFYPAIHVEPPSVSSQVTVNSISASFDSSWNPVLQNRFPAAYEWIPSKTITCDSSKTYSLFLNITVDSSIVQRAVRVACLAAPPPTTVPVETTTTMEITTVTVPTTVVTTVVTTVETTVETTVDTTVTTVATTTDVPSTSTIAPVATCSRPGVSYSFLLSYSTELDAKTFGLVSSTIVQAVENYPYNGTTLTDSYLDSTIDTIQKPATVIDFSNDLQAKLPSPTNALGETLGSNVVSILQKFISTTSDATKPIPYDNSVLLLLPNRLQTSSASDLTNSNYIDFVNKNVKVFTVISLASLVAQGQMVGRTGKVFNRLAAASNGHYIVANETIFGRDVNSDYNKVVAQVMQFGYGQDLLFSRNIGSTRLRTDIGTVSIPKSATETVSITITVSLSVVDTNAPNPPNRLLLALKPGSTSGAIAINFLTDVTVTRYDTSNFYITTITVPAGEDRGLVLQYIPGVDDNDLLIRMWVDRSTYHTAKYVNLALADGSPDDKEGAALRVTLQNDCYNTNSTQAKILITDCNGDVSTKYGSSQLSGSPLTSSFPYFGFVPFFCDSPPSTSTSCVSGTEAKYDVQFTFEDYSLTRSFWCSKSSEAFDAKCTKQDAYGNYQCTGNSPFMTGPTGKVPDCSGHGSLSVNFTGGIGKEVYSCQCDDGYQQPNCASAKCSSPNLDPLAIDNSYHTFTLILGLDNSISTFSVIQLDLEQFLILSEVPSIWKYQLLAYCTDGTLTNLYSGGEFSKFYEMMKTDTIPVHCPTAPTDGSVDLTTVFNSAVRGIGRNVRGMIVYYTESQKTLAVNLEDFVVASRAYRQELFVFTGYINETTPIPLPQANANISQAAISTGGFYVQSLLETAHYIPQISNDFVSTILTGKTSLAYLSTQQSTGFNVAVNNESTVAWVVTWGRGTKFETDNLATVKPADCMVADDTMAMCKLTGATSYNFIAPSDGAAYTTAVFITNEDFLSPRFQIISDLSQDASNAVSTTSSATRTIVSMHIPPGYKIVNNDGDGGLTRTIQRDQCTFQATAYSVFADSKYSAGANTAMITLQQEDGNVSSPKYTRYFSFGTTASPICQNGGSPVASTGSCSCPSGFQGPDCSLVNCELASSANAWSDVCVCQSLEDVACANRYTSFY